MASLNQGLLQSKEAQQIAQIVSLIQKSAVFLDAARKGRVDSSIFFSLLRMELEKRLREFLLQLRQPPSFDIPAWRFLITFLSTYLLARQLTRLRVITAQPSLWQLLFWTHIATRPSVRQILRPAWSQLQSAVAQKARPFCQLIVQSVVIPALLKTCWAIIGFAGQLSPTWLPSSDDRQSLVCGIVRTSLHPFVQIRLDSKVIANKPTIYMTKHSTLADITYFHFMPETTRLAVLRCPMESSVGSLAWKLLHHTIIEPVLSTSDGSRLRRNPSSDTQYRQMKRLLQKGTSILFIPYGAQNANDPVSEFGITPFSLAIDMQVPVIPLRVTHETFEQENGLRQQIHITALGSVQPENASLEQMQSKTKQLLDTNFGIISSKM